jgi:DNA modification methylase
MERFVRVSGRGEPLAAAWGDDVRFSPQLAEHFIAELTQPEDVVLDPFAGFGTALVVAEKMRRRAAGVELLADRATYIRQRVSASTPVLTADARRLRDLDLPAPDLVITSPPYMTANDHPQNPLTGYSTLDGDYDEYLTQVGSVFQQVAEVLRPGGHLVINVANLRHEDVITSLAWDIGRLVSRWLTLRRDVVVLDDDLPPWISQDYCLVFGR